eukprot:3253975-Alexandrium_andersonii.AAC.1
MSSVSALAVRLHRSFDVPACVSVFGQARAVMLSCVGALTLCFTACGQPSGLVILTAFGHLCVPPWEGSAFDTRVASGWVRLSLLSPQGLVSAAGRLTSATLVRMLHPYRS